MSQLFASGNQSIGASASAAVLPMNIQDCFPLGLPGLVSLQSKVPSSIFFNTIVQKHQFFSFQPSLWSNSYIHAWLLEKPQLGLSEPLSEKQCIFFLICCLGLSEKQCIFFLICCLGLSKGQAPFNFMAAVTVCSDFWSPRKLNLSLFPHLYAMKQWNWMPWS